MAMLCLPLLILAIGLTGVSSAKTGHTPLGHKNYIGYYCLL